MKTKKAKRKVRAIFADSNHHHHSAQVHYFRCANVRQTMLIPQPTYFRSVKLLLEPGDWNTCVYTQSRFCTHRGFVISSFDRRAIPAELESRSHKRLYTQSRFATSLRQQHSRLSAQLELSFKVSRYKFYIITYLGLSVQPKPSYIDQWTSFPSTYLYIYKFFS